MKNKGNNGFGLFNGFTYATNHLMGNNSNLLTGTKARINKEAFEKLELLKYSKDYYRKKGTGRPSKKDRRDLEDFTGSVSED